MNNAIIIGGGVIGLASAHYLSKSGRNVTVIDRGEMGNACSHANCGLICPSHVLPLAVSGAIRQGIRSLFSRNAAFRVKPRLDLSLWSWFWHFSRRCNRRDMIEAGHAIQPLMDSSRDLYQQLIDAHNLDCEWETRGTLHVFQTTPAMDAQAETEELLAEHFGVHAKRYDGRQLLDLEPALKPDLAGGWHYEHDAHLRPDRLMSAWKAHLVNNGVTFLEHCEFESITNSNTVSIQTNQGELNADCLIFATGAWTPKLNAQLGCRIPIQPGKGYSMTMPRPQRCPAIPLLFPEHRVVVTPMQSGYRLGSIMEFAGYDASLNPQRLTLLKTAAEHYLHEPYCETVTERWYGWRPMTYDSIPIIGRVPKLSNVYIAAGHNMLGLSMAPATGKLLAEIIDGESTHIDAGPYSLQRFL